MRCFFVVALCAFANAAMIDIDTILARLKNTEAIKCVIIRNISYEEEILKRDVRGPYQLSIDYDSTTLFYSYTNNRTQLSNEGNGIITDITTFQMAYLNLKTNEEGIVYGIRGGFATAVNNKGQTVYLGGEDGIYKFNYNTKCARNLYITDASIWQMFYKNGLYFTTYPEEQAFFYNKGEVIEIPEFKNVTKVKMLAVKKNGDYVFYNSSRALYTYDKELKAIFPLGDYILSGITSDVDGNLYFSTTNTIYHIDDDNNIEKLAKYNNLFGLSVEWNGNFIYSNDNSIVRLKPTTRMCLNITSHLPKNETMIKKYYVKTAKNYTKIM